jgi:hypothetical protein
MKKGGTEIFGIPFDRHMQTYDQVERKKDQTKPVDPVWAHFTVWKIFVREKCLIAKELSQNILISKKKNKKRHVFV